MGDKCKCVYANARNTPSVLHGYQMGGYLVEKCAACAALSSPAPAAGGAEVVAWACWSCDGLHLLCRDEADAKAYSKAFAHGHDWRADGLVLQSDHARLLAEAKQRAAAMEADAMRWREVSNKAWFVDAAAHAYDIAGSRWEAPTYDEDDVTAQVDTALLAPTTTDEGKGNG